MRALAAEDPIDAVRRSYGAGITDEFIEPIVCPACPRLARGGDTAIFFNFRPDRARQLSRRLLAEGVDLTTMTRYAEDIDTPAAFPEQEVRQTLAEVLSGAGVRQLHAAETEKYAHVTYFFNGGEEREWEGEDRVLVPSPRDVPSYDLKPEMSAAGVAAEVVERLPQGHGFCVVNFANPDMVGHTGVIPAVVRAVEAADAALGEVVRGHRRPGRRLPRHRRPRQRGDHARAGRHQPAHGPHDEPGAARRHRAPEPAFVTTAASPTSLRPRSTSSACIPEAMPGSRRPQRSTGNDRSGTMLIA